MLLRAFFKDCEVKVRKWGKHLTWQLCSGSHQLFFQSRAFVEAAFLFELQPRIFFYQLLHLLPICISLLLESEQKISFNRAGPVTNGQRLASQLWSVVLCNPITSAICWKCFACCGAITLKHPVAISKAKGLCFRWIFASWSNTLKSSQS